MPSMSWSRSVRCPCRTASPTSWPRPPLLQGITAHYLSTSTHVVEAGENVVIHAAAGGVGLAAHADGGYARRAGNRDHVDGGEGAARARGGSGGVISYDGFAEG